MEGFHYCIHQSAFLISIAIYGLLGMGAVIPKALRESLKLKKGDKLEAKVEDKNGLPIYSKR